MRGEALDITADRGWAGVSPVGRDRSRAGAGLSVTSHSTMVVPFAAGGPVDTVARILSERDARSRSVRASS